VQCNIIWQVHEYKKKIDTVIIFFFLIGYHFCGAGAFALYFNFLEHSLSLWFLHSLTDTVCITSNDFFLFNRKHELNQFFFLNWPVFTTMTIIFFLLLLMRNGYKIFFLDLACELNGSSADVRIILMVCVEVRKLYKIRNYFFDSPICIFFMIRNLIVLFFGNVKFFFDAIWLKNVWQLSRVLKTCVFKKKVFFRRSAFVFFSLFYVFLL